MLPEKQARGMFCLLAKGASETASDENKSFHFGVAVRVLYAQCDRRIVASYERIRNMPEPQVYLVGKFRAAVGKISSKVGPRT